MPGKTFLDSVFEGSQRQAVQVQDRLRMQAFQVVEALAQGIAASASQPVAAADLPRLYQEAIVILYRFVYFLSHGARLLRQGGRLPYIVANKWLRAGYGEGLRGFLSQEADVEQIVDFGHAPIFNEAFLIDTPTKERLVRGDARSAELLRPYLRGQDIKRWSPEWAGLWIILLKSSENQAWPWSEAGSKAESIFAHIYPAVYEHLKPLESALRKRQDKGRFWWELRSCAYYAHFERPKLVYQEIQFHPAYGYDADGRFANNKVFLLPSADPYLLAVLNSPLMWWHNWRYLPHMKDEALNPKGDLMETLPIAPPADAQRAKVEPAVERLIAATRERQAAVGDLLFWLRTEFDVTEPGQRLEAFATLTEEDFVREVGRRRPRQGTRSSPADLHMLRGNYADYATRVRALDAESAQLERRLADLVNRAYGLTPQEVDLLWRTAPPRMPGAAPAS
jgi:hypothetical protein